MIFKQLINIQLSISVNIELEIAIKMDLESSATSINSEAQQTAWDNFFYLHSKSLFRVVLLFFRVSTFIQSAEMKISLKSVSKLQKNIPQYPQAFHSLALDEVFSKILFKLILFQWQIIRWWWWIRHNQPSAIIHNNFLFMTT